MQIFRKGHITHGILKTSDLKMSIAFIKLLYSLPAHTKKFAQTRGGVRGCTQMYSAFCKRSFSRSVSCLVTFNYHRIYLLTFIDVLRCTQLKLKILNLILVTALNSFSAMDWANTDKPSIHCWRMCCFFVRHIHVIMRSPGHLPFVRIGCLQNNVTHQFSQLG